MITTNIQEFCLVLPATGVIMAIDYGTKKLGIAISDHSRVMSLPIAIVETDIKNLDSLVQQHKVVGVAIGLPINMDGTSGAQAELVEKFAQRVFTRLELPIFLQDERLTTKAASNALKILGLNRKQRDSRDDQVAASMILDTVLGKIGLLG